MRAEKVTEQDEADRMQIKTSSKWMAGAVTSSEERCELAHLLFGSA